MVPEELVGDCHPATSADGLLAIPDAVDDLNQRLRNELA